MLKSIILVFVLALTGCVSIPSQQSSQDYNPMAALLELEATQARGTVPLQPHTTGLDRHPHPAHQTQYSYVVAENVVTQYVRGELRFCEAQFVRGIVCGHEMKLFGKKKFAARDWWSPYTYVKAATGLVNPEIIGVEPYSQNGLVIYFR